MSTDFFSIFVNASAGKNRNKTYSVLVLVVPMRPGSATRLGVPSVPWPARAAAIGRLGGWRRSTPTPTVLPVLLARAYVSAA
jgi:hypothetical protein